MFSLAELDISTQDTSGANGHVQAVSCE